MCWACSEGKLDVLKLLLPYMDNTDPANYLCCVAAKLCVEENQKDQSLLMQLRQIVEYISNFGDRRRVLKKVGNLVEQHPVGCSLILNMMGEGIDDQLTCSRMGMTSFPISWILHDDYTTIDISHNQLKVVPAKLFHLTKLKRLDVSHNLLQAIPSPLNWDCPSLQDLSLAANDLRNEQWKVLVSSKIFTPFGSTTTIPRDSVNVSTVSAPVLMRVDISGNVKLSVFPEWLCLLPSLTILDIRGIPLLHTLPPQLSLARNLCVIKLDPEYITSPSPSEVALGTSAIMTYLRCRHRGSLPFRQIRVVILGEPATGKYTLYSSFVGPNSSSSPKARMNIGRFDYPQRRFFSNDRPRVTFQVVCFTGVESSRHFLSQCFYTYRSIFLVLWKITDGEEGLLRLKQQLHNIQARVPGSPVILVGTHADQNTTVTATTVGLWEGKLFGCDSHQATTVPVKNMLPHIADSILMNCMSKKDIEQLQLVLYKQAMEMKNPWTKKPFVEELVPRSYVELQSLIQSEVKTIYTLKEGVPVKRRGHFINFVKAHTFHSSTELEDDDTELDSACRFLHDAGIIVHYNVYELNDIYFLDPQWLYNTLYRFIDPSNTSGSILNVADITSFLKEVGGAGLQHYLFKIMELFNIAVCLDMDRERFLVPSLLKNKRPNNYPSYNLLASNMNCKHFYFGYLPDGFCAKLVAHVLLHMKQVLAQLMACCRDIPVKPTIVVNDDGESHEDEVVEVDKDCTEYVIDFQTGYVIKDDSVGDDQVTGSEQTELKRKLMTLGTLPKSPARDSKIFTLTRPMVKINRHSSSYDDLLLSWVYWQEGMYICFSDHTQLWLEPTTEGVVVVVSGDALPRVKVLSYISNCVDMLCEEHYLGLVVTVENPCPSCIRRCVGKDDSFNNEDEKYVVLTKGGIDTTNGACAYNTLQAGNNSASYKLDMESSPDALKGSHDAINLVHDIPNASLGVGNGLQGILTESSDISNLLLVSQPGSVRNSTDMSTTDNSPIVSRSPSNASALQAGSARKNLFAVPAAECTDDTAYLFPSLADSLVEPMPTLDHVRSHVKMFTNTECIAGASTKDHMIPCESCDRQVKLRSVDPSVLLEDFRDNLLVDPHLLQCDMNSEELGTGSYAKVTN